MSHTILIVEDNELNLRMARDLLRFGGFQILEAPDAETGIALARRHRPDLVLMDMYLPDIDGYEATRILKLDPLTRDITVIAFTALAREPEELKAFESGCSGLIVKPIDVDTFVQTIQNYLVGTKLTA